MMKNDWRTAVLAGALALLAVAAAVFAQGKEAAAQTEQEETTQQETEAAGQGAGTAKGIKQELYDGLDPDEVILTVGKDAVPLRKAYFLLKFQQAVVESVYGSNWSAYLGGDEIEDFQKDMKDSIMNLLIRMSLARQYQEEYDIALTKEEQADINQTVDAFMKSNSDEAQQAMMADEAILTEILEDYTLLSKMTGAVTGSTSVEYGNAKTYAYIYASLGENAGSLLEDTDESTEKTLANFASVYNRVSSGEDFYTVAAELGYPAALHTYFAEDDGDAMQEMNQIMDSIKTGEISKVEHVGDDRGVFIGYAVQDDEDSLNSAKEDYLKREKSRVLKEQMQKWMKENEPVVNQELWDQVNLERSIKAYVVQTGS